MKIKRFFWLSLLLVLIVISGCQLFSPSNVETIVLENNLKYWYLSPNGDYLVYGSPRGKSNFLLNLATGQEHEFGCRLLWWDTYKVGCYGTLDSSIIDVKSLAETPLTPIDLTKEVEINKLEYENILFVNQLLIDAEMIYRPDWTTDTVYILAFDYQHNPEKNYVVKGLTNSDEILGEYPYKLVPPESSNNPQYEKTFSPNDLYYYQATIDGFVIYNANNNQAISEFVEEDMGNLDILGWTPDSSGVYFITHGVGFLNTNLPKAIRKLKIPDE